MIFTTILKSLISFKSRIFSIKRWGQRIPAYLIASNHEPNNVKWFVGHSLEEVKSQAVEFFKTDNINIQQGAVRVRLFKILNKYFII